MNMRIVGGTAVHRSHALYTNNFSQVYPVPVAVAGAAMSLSLPRLSARELGAAAPYWVFLTKTAKSQFWG
jgi:hypothetical protein